MRFIFLTCVTILMFLTSLTLETSPSQEYRSNQTETDESLVWYTEGNEKEYANVLKLSFLFFEAMRSGILPKNNRIPWRGNSMKDDHGTDGEDLTGGYFNAGDTYVKYAFQTAFTTTMLAWGVLLWPQAYGRAGQLNETYNAIKWATDYFIKCHAHKNSFYIQVGSKTAEIQYFGRPDDMIYDRPSYKADCEYRASDIVSEAAAALAAASIVYKDIFHDEPYSKVCLKHAKQLYRFALQCPGSHYKWMTDMHENYKNYEVNPLRYFDDWSWAALWLYKATKDFEYLRQAEGYYWSYILRDDIKTERTLFDYFAKIPGIEMIFSDYSINTQFSNSVKQYIKEIVQPEYHTNKGLLFLHEDPLPLAANAAFLCLVAASSGKDDTGRCYSFAKHQIDYMLGLKSRRSYVVGYGKNPPTRIRHKASLCPYKPAPCGWEQETNQPNQQILYGALVSGPDVHDFFNNTRNSKDPSKYTKVRIDYNAGFTGALAGLLQLHSSIGRI